MTKNFNCHTGIIILDKWPVHVPDVSGTRIGVWQKHAINQTYTSWCTIFRTHWCGDLLDKLMYPSVGHTDRWAPILDELMYCTYHLVDTDPAPPLRQPDATNLMCVSLCSSESVSYIWITSTPSVPMHLGNQVRFRQHQNSARPISKYSSHWKKNNKEI